MSHVVFIITTLVLSHVVFIIDVYCMRVHGPMNMKLHYTASTETFQYSVYWLYFSFRCKSIPNNKEAKFPRKM
jgi:hypothetical protein